MAESSGIPDGIKPQLKRTLFVKAGKPTLKNTLINALWALISVFLTEILLQKPQNMVKWYVNFDSTPIFKQRS